MIGLDIAKTVFQMHGTDALSKTAIGRAKQAGTTRTPWLAARTIKIGLSTACAGPLTRATRPPPSPHTPPLAIEAVRWARPPRDVRVAAQGSGAQARPQILARCE